MKTNKLDKSIKEKFDNRTFTPSASAWERLSVQLDEQPKQKKFGWFFYISAAASILVLVTIGVSFFSDDVQTVVPKNKIVITPSDKKVIDKKIDKLINEVPVPEAIVIKEALEIKKEIIHTPVIAKSDTKRIDNKINNQNKIINNTVITNKVDDKAIIIAKEIEDFKTRHSSKKQLKQDPNSAIKINADDLLYAVTHTSKEVKAYYAKYNINREDVLKTIKGELKKSNLKVDPNTILAEVERSIDDDYFENSFMKSLKRRVSDIAVAISSRND
ncbi:hypothetical protein [Polaribacter sp. R77954]|uniref:hypothetical protein n=1 Tax=Polaribacter sp. R77954 TaxID=3093870 RepID=UPI0037C517D4